MPRSGPVNRYHAMMARTPSTITTVIRLMPAAALRSPLSTGSRVGGGLTLIWLTRHLLGIGLANAQRVPRFVSATTRRGQIDRRLIRLGPVLLVDAGDVAQLANRIRRVVGGVLEFDRELSQVRRQIGRAGQHL